MAPKAERRRGCLGDPASADSHCGPTLAPGEYRQEASTILPSGSPWPRAGENEPNIVGDAPRSLPEALTLGEQEGAMHATWVSQGRLLRGGGL